MSPENPGGRGDGCDDSTHLADEGLVPQGTPDVSRHTTHSSPRLPDLASGPLTDASPEPQVEANGHDTLREAFLGQELPSEVTEFLLAAWRPGTLKQYRRHIEQWNGFCLGRAINPFQPPVSL